MKAFLQSKEVKILIEKHNDSAYRKQADMIKTILFLNKGFSFEETVLTRHLREHIYQTVKEVVLYVQKTYHKVYSIEGMTTMLHRLGFSYELDLFLQDQKRVHIIYLPAYSSSLNIIERLCKFFHSKHHDKYFEKFKDFEVAVLSFFQNIHKYDAELRTLLTDSFQKLTR